MKILFIFCDMIRADLLKTFNPRAKRDPLLDEWLEKLGGTAYTNCYTPGPDTPRSTAALYSGKIPKNNNCHHRNRWSASFLGDQYTVFSLLKENNIDAFGRVRENGLKVGILPLTADQMKVSTSLQEAAKLFKDSKSKDKFFFADIPDFHYAMDEIYGGPLAYTRGTKQLRKSLDMLLENINLDEFDYVFFFSDHGCKLKLKERLQDPLLSILDHRSKIAMLVKKKGERGLSKNDKLCSVVDVLPTMLDIFGKKKQLDGHSLFSKKEHEAIVIDDYVNMQTGLHMHHDVWGVKTKDSFYITSYDKELFLKKKLNGYETTTPHKKEYFKKLLLRDSSTYKESLAYWDALKRYRETVPKPAPYTNGSKRLSKPMAIIFRIVSNHVGILIHFLRKIKKL